MTGIEAITLATALIAAAGAVFAALLTLHGNKATNQVKGQVTNDHDTNLREDIDKLTELVDEGFKQNTRDIGGLREEMRIERQERIAGDQRR